MEMPDELKAVLIDLAGVLHTGDEALAGAVPALKRLRGAGLALRFLTNTTRTPGSVLFTKLCRMGFELSAAEIQTAALAARTLVRERGLRPHWMVHPNIADEMGPDDREPNVVVLGDMGEYFSYAGLNHAFRLLMQGCPLIAMARNRYFMESDGLTLDMGGAQAAGIAGILVRTGKFRAGDDANPDIRPALTVDDFAAAVDRLVG
ncbi:MAG: HAD hydrolase-like protein [Dechloromonas sp.]|nr:HAD hydrolase-like protein [Dechloromonas sp.]